MTSEERRKARYERRIAARRTRRKLATEEYDNYDRLCTCNTLFEAARQSRRSISWKESAQRYFMSYTRNILETRQKLLKGENVFMGFIEFDMCERGKLRHIRAVHFKERVVQRALCDNALIPVLSRSLIYDNGASIKGKGISFARNRLKRHLHEYYRRTGGNVGYVLIIDFKGYFDNVQHDPIYRILENSFADKRIVELCRKFIEPFGDKSIGIGSQVSQILAVTYRSYIDHYVKEILRIKEYGCYMDDSYLISESKEYLHKCLDKIEQKCAERGIVINRKKTQIVKISRGFTYMKGVFYLTETGRIIVKPCRTNTARERRKLKKFKALYEKGQMTLEQILCSYNSFRGYIAKEYNSRKTVGSMDKLFHKQFCIPINREDKYSCMYT